MGGEKEKEKKERIENGKTFLKTYSTPTSTLKQL